MRLASYITHGRSGFGAVVGNGVVDMRLRMGPRFPTLLDVLREGALDELRAGAAGVRPDYPLADVRFLPPVVGPEKIICVGVNYTGRSGEFQDPAEDSKFPNLFFRAPGSLVGHLQPLVRPRESEQLDYEGEIALVIGRRGRRIPVEEALAYVAGYTLCNEGTVRDWLRHGSRNITPGKNFDASGSLGPWIVTADEIDPGQPLRLTTRVNGELRQDATTAAMIFGFAELIAYVSTFTTLVPGDVIVTGTPVGAGARFEPPRWLEPGDVVEIAVPEIGVLRNEVVDEP
ncbi:MULTISPECIES: fumarylacetoacetate hydrolase family protein [Rhodoplanes]|jgi:2-keto-4-pentenoate hydratase/2-oxohepta-3-ene-1,7-dioic acid hydratase in catechol pathway|uniref:Homoprotocatechuate catabolism bifunctional isomerase/decarboxylase n=1 Tax=Rhodoplanes serenus TaxID=200615 RepID=A0A327K3H7_9BRAD|nr:fumarylacetoacetate hydrolase family protein [Rhodoplanes serenus]MBI5113324.1 fumarylacetoacetate hydrolase family protein [Rhodovulum sp.]RAI32363.1 2-hydroxyhepta-2,4-diene-1,7-dioate isomerase [Rhodoplanes serenus]VCU08035.1 Homoprotocatechuate catabolism bifunctional isomerase/decarboxylase [Rhodoplanes serenus]